MLEPINRDMHCQVVNAVKRLAKGQRHSLCRRGTDQKSADQTRSRSDGDRIYICQRDMCGCKRTLKRCRHR